MTIAEMHIQFKLSVDKIDSFNSDLFEPEEIDNLFNTSQYELIKKITTEGIEETETKGDMLSVLKVRQPLGNIQANNLLVNHVGGYFVGLPNDYLKTINEECICTITDCHGDTVTERRTVIPITEDRVLSALENPFQKPDNKYVLRLKYSEKNSGFAKRVHELITHDAVPTFYILTYYREPIAMQYGSQYPTILPDVDCELSIEAQYWIIEDAVKQALLGIESQRYVPKSQEQDKLNY
jgi:hypothetical protein